MGKLKRSRQNLRTTKSKYCETGSTRNTKPIPITVTPSDNLFAGIDINVDTLTTNLNEDAISIKSFKSMKSEMEKVITKKEKLRLKRETLMRKMDILNQLKKKASLKKKRKHISIIGDTNPLHDALPSLESLLKNRNDVMTKKIVAPKAIQKSSKRKKKLLQGIGIYKVLINKNIKKNVLRVANEHIKATLQYKQ